jgi:Rps23 Pro-64 3,4-dihydroxylase Tpa1-like proline 4-hydroxylase
MLGVADSVFQRAAHDLSRQGFSILPKIVSPSICSSFRQEISLLHSQGCLYTNTTQLVRGDAKQLFPKHKIYEFDSEHPNWPVRVHQSSLLQTLFEDDSMMTLLSVFMPQLSAPLSSQTLKVQLNEGGCFPMHYDSDRAVDTRRITAILYLNDDWNAAADGGELSLLPFPFGRVAVSPEVGTMVLFSSSYLLHRVHPCFRTRYCLTIWMSSALNRRHSSNHRDPVPLLSQLDVPKLIANTETRKLISRVIYEKDWEQSILESHEMASHQIAIIERHRRDVQVIRDALGSKMDDIERLSSNEKLEKMVSRLEWF